MKKGKEKKEENYIKKGEKNASFWAINSKKIRPARSKLICRGKKFNLKREGVRGNDQNAQYIPLLLMETNKGKEG